MRKDLYAKKLLEQWKSILQLSDYVIQMKLHRKLDPDEQYCYQNGSTKSATIGISLNQPIADMQWAIGHELLHVVTDPTFRAFWSHTKHYGKRSHSNVMEQYNCDENLVIEHLLRIVYTAKGWEYPPHKIVDEIIND